MNARTEVQIIKGSDGLPEYAVLPYKLYQALVEKTSKADYVPHDVVERAFGDPPMSAVRAWREHLGLTQAEMAERLGISQSAYAQQEASTRLRKATREKIAAALGIKPAQLDF